MKIFLDIFVFSFICSAIAERFFNELPKNFGPKLSCKLYSQFWSRNNKKLPRSGAPGFLAAILAYVMLQSRQNKISRPVRATTSPKAPTKAGSVRDLILPQPFAYCFLS
ncbi:MAG: hypothetical protein PHU56_02635 [Candidatus Pacebacteria bacterium]|nr:hypothetical protein [Candidatus Paceibacterota bacterium]